MILDLDRKTVTVKADTTLTLEQLWGIIDVMDADIESDVFMLLNSAADPEAGRVYVEPTNIFMIESDQRRYLYCVVRLSDGTWACSCPDWIHRRSESYGMCKHIIRQLWLV